MAAAHSVPQAAGAPLAKGMDADCMAMMAKQQPAPSEKPCKGLTLDCIAAMGCVIPLVAADLAGGIAPARPYDAPSSWTTDTIFTGQAVAPEPEPEPEPPVRKPCLTNPQPWSPPNKYRWGEERGWTKKKLTPPDL